VAVDLRGSKAAAAAVAMAMLTDSVQILLVTV
jgi:hypothetical protein